MMNDNGVCHPVDSDHQSVSVALPPLLASTADGMFATRPLLVVPEKGASRYLRRAQELVDVMHTLRAVPLMDGLPKMEGLLGLGEKLYHLGRAPMGCVQRGEKTFELGRGS